MLGTMAKKRTDADRHKNRVLSLRPPPSMRAALERLAKEQRRSVAQVALLLLERILVADKLWQPEQEGDNP
jgi:hypothetical protein